MNSRIFSRFSQVEIDSELQQTGDLMALLERGKQDFDREENEKNSQIENAIKTITTPTPPVKLSMPISRKNFPSFSLIR